MGYHGEKLAGLAPPLERGVERFAERTTKKVGEAWRDRVRRYTPVAPEVEQGGTGLARVRLRRPGTLRDSWDVSDVKRIGSVVFRLVVSTDDPIAPFVEWDTQPHIIRPRADRAAASVIDTGKPRRMGSDPQASLAWFSGGRMIFAREVHHPGTKGAHMMLRASSEMSVEWVDVGRREWDAEARAILRGR